VAHVAHLLIQESQRRPTSARSAGDCPSDWPLDYLPPPQRPLSAAHHTLTYLHQARAQISHTRHETRCHSGGWVPHSASSGPPLRIQRGRGSEGARERGSEGARERGSEGARERGREGERERGREGEREEGEQRRGRRGRLCRERPKPELKQSSPTPLPRVEQPTPPHGPSHSSHDSNQLTTAWPCSPRAPRAHAPPQSSHASVPPASGVEHRENPWLCCFRRPSGPCPT